MKYLGLIFLILTPFIVEAQSVERLNARFYPQEHLEIEMQWAQPLHGAKNRQRENLLIAKTKLNELRLTIPSQYIGASKNIYLSIPQQFPGIRDHGVQIRWETRGHFISGSAKPGERVLLFSGPITDVVLSDQIIFTFIIDARYVYGPMEFHPVYEIE